MFGKMELFGRPKWAVWIFPFVAVAAATGARIWLESSLGSKIPYGLFFLAIAITAHFAGFRPALLATALSAGIADWLFIPPYYSFAIASTDDLAALVLFIGISGIISFLGYVLQWSRRALERTAGNLAEVVQMLDLATVLVRDLDDRITRWHAGCERLYGFSSREAIGHVSHELLMTRFPAPLEEIRATLMSTGHWEGEVLHTAADGREVTVMSEWSLARDAQGRPIAVLEANRDITLRKHAEERVRATEDEIRLIIDATPAMISYIGADYRYRRINRVFEEWTGRKASEIIGRAVYEVLPADAWLEAKPQMDRVLNGESVTYERMMLRDGAEPRWGLVTYVPSLDRSGLVVGFVSHVVDITARKHAEEELARSRAQLETVVDSMDEGLVIADVHGHVSHWNRSAQTLFGCKSLEECQGPFERFADIFEVLDLNGREVPFEEWPISRILRGERFREHELRIRRRGVLWERIYSYGGALVRDPSGRKDLAVLTVSDITDRKLSQQLVEQAKREAEAANDAKDRFLAVLSHELRTPLTPVLAAVSLIERRQAPGDEQAELVQIIRRNVELESRLIDDLLDLTRIARGRISLEAHRINLEEIIGRVIEVCRPDIDARKLHFGVQLEGGPHYIDGDPSRLQQIFWNLVKNAIKFTPDGGSIVLRAYGKGSNVIVEVADTGIGIEHGQLTKIFDAFEQAERPPPQGTDQFGGLGLGLAISKRLVELHRGSIEAISPGLGQGSTFRITFPLAPAQEPAAESAVTHQPEPTKVLLVEDHGDTAKMMGHLLRKSGYEVETAGDLHQALDAVSTKKFDVLISDLGLPDGTGLELMAELRRRGDPIKAIALTGFGRDDDVQNSKRAGFDEHFTKPADFSALADAVQRLARAA